MLEACKGRQIHIQVTPNARKTQITRILDEVIFLDVSSRAENGEANRKIENFFEKILGESVQIIRGKQSKKKVLLRKAQ